MRVIAMVCALAIGAGFGTFFWRVNSVPSGSTSVPKSSPAVELTRNIVRPAEERAVSPANPAKLATASEVPPNVSRLLAQGSSAIDAEPVGTLARPSAQATSLHPASGTFSCPANPNALSISRVVEIDTTGGPGFGFEQFKAYDFLREGEVVLTFDDGPWPKNTSAVLAALASHCTKAIFFPIGLHATYEPQILKQVAAAGHAVGSHTWCHQDLSKTKGTCLVNGKRESYEYDPKDEIEKGISAVHWAVGAPTAPFFAFLGYGSRQS